MKEYICPNCKQPFTRLERGEDPRFPHTGFEKMIGNITSVFSMLIGLPVLLIGLAVFIYGIYTKNLVMLVVPIIFIIVGSVFFLGGLDDIYPIRRHLCPNCGIYLRKKGNIYIAPGGIHGSRK